MADMERTSRRVVESNAATLMDARASGPAFGGLLAPAPAPATAPASAPVRRTDAAAEHMWKGKRCNTKAFTTPQNNDDE